MTRVAPRLMLKMQAASRPLALSTLSNRLGASEVYQVRYATQYLERKKLINKDNKGYSLTSKGQRAACKLTAIGLNI